MKINFSKQNQSFLDSIKNNPALKTICLNETQLYKKKWKENFWKKLLGKKKIVRQIWAKYKVLVIARKTINFKI